MTGSLVPEREGLEWCLFLDRDGVINRRLPGDYVRRWAQFEYIPGALKALCKLSKWAPHTVIVSNQQGVAKGLMSRSDLDDIHYRLVGEVQAAGGRIDDVLVCIHREDDRCDCRKPQPGLAAEWLTQHPDVMPAKSIMVGDAASDVLMARNLAAITGGCTAVLVGDTVSRAAPDFQCWSLAELAAVIEEAKREAAE